MTDQNQQEKEPTRDEVIAWYKSQIELASLRAELATLQATAVKAEAERMQAAMFLAQMDAAAQSANNSDGGGETPSDEKPNPGGLKRV